MGIQDALLHARSRPPEEKVRLIVLALGKETTCMAHGPEEVSQMFLVLQRHLPHVGLEQPWVVRAGDLGT